MGADKADQHTAAFEGAVPTGPGGPRPADVGTPHTTNIYGGIPYVSDRPYVPPSYAERLPCAGIRKDSQPCGAKARDGGTCCTAHADQEG